MPSNGRTRHEAPATAPPPPPRFEGLKRLCGRVAAPALLLAALAATAPPAAATEQVSNFSANADNEDVAGYTAGNLYELAQSFTTGSNVGGYGLNNVKLKFSGKQGSPPNIQVWLHAASGGSTGVALKQLSGPASPSSQDATYASSPARRLEPQTSYFVVLKAPGATGPFNYYSVYRTSSGNQTGSAGWLIADGRKRKSGGGNWNGFNGPLILSVDADALSVSLTAGTPTATGNTLTIANYTGAWRYKYASPSGGQCSDEVAAGTSSTTVTGLSGNTRYTFKAYSDNDCATELAAASAFLTKPARPARPAAAPGAGSGRLVLSASVAGGAGALEKWQYAQKTTGAYGGWRDIPNSTAAALSHTVTGLDDGTNYTFKVRAKNATGFSAESADSDAAAPLDETLAVGAVTATGARLTLSNWPGAWHYKYTTPPGDTSCTEVAAGISTADVTGLTPGVSYIFAAYSDGACSARLAAADEFIRPGAVQGVAAESLDRALRVSWSAAAGASGYAVQWKSGRQGYAAARQASVAAGTAYTIGGLENGAAYTVRVRASNGALWSAEAAGVPGAALRGRLGRVNAALAPEAARAFAGGAARVVSGRIARAVSGDAAPAPSARMLAGFAERHGEAASQGASPLRAALAGAAASLPFAAAGADGGSSGGGLWVAGDYGRLEGGGSALSWDGSASGLYLGADAAPGPGLLGGVAMSVSEASFDYADRGPAAAKGEWTARMTGLHPYAARHWDDSSVLWALAGYGWGEVEIGDGGAGRRQEADSELLSLAAGGSMRLAPASAGLPALDLKGEALAARLDVAGNDDLVEAAEADVHRLRVAVSGAWALAAGPGASLAPSAELGLRHDGGDGETGFGLETGAGLAWAAQRLRLEANARALLAHGGEVEEWGAGALASLEPDGRGRGLSLSLSPALGHAGSGLDRLWEEGVAADGASSSGARPAARLEAGAGYGLPLPGAPGALLTPRIGLAATDAGQRRYSAGLALERGPQAALALEAAQTQRPETPPETALTLTLNFRW